MKIRAQMIDNDTLLKGIVEADETYIGGKPRYRKKKGEIVKSKRGRGTSKAPVSGRIGSARRESYCQTHGECR